MSIIKRLINIFLNLLPYKFLIKNYPKLKNTKLCDCVNSVLYKRFFKESKLITDFDNYIKKIANSEKYYVIKAGIWNYKICNFCFLKDMLSIIIWCLECGYKPVIDILPDSDYYTEKSNLWELYFYQPFRTELNNIDMTKTKICPIKEYAVKIKMCDAFDDFKTRIWHRFFENLIVAKKSTQQYFDKEYDEIIKNKKVIGCVVRGTDYTKLKPKGHPKQPEIDELVDKLNEYLEKYSYDYIYLATEEKRIADAIKERFPGKVLENKRNYFDEKYFSNKNSDMVSKVHFDRENDDYLKMLEYMSSINLVSKCDALVSGLCGGSEIAIYWNGLNYNEKFLFDKGLY